MPFLYDRAITASEVKQLYLNPFGLFETSFNLTLFGALDDGGGGEVGNTGSPGGVKSGGKDGGKDCGKQN
jgi:hypothetical protein